MYIKRSLLEADILDLIIKYPHEQELLNGFLSLVKKQPEQAVRSEVTCHGMQKLGFYEYCSECKKLTYLDKYCASCGAKVIRGEHKEDA